MRWLVVKTTLLLPDTESPCVHLLRMGIFLFQYFFEPLFVGGDCKRFLMSEDDEAWLCARGLFYKAAGGTVHRDVGGAGGLAEMRGQGGGE